MNIEEIIAKTAAAVATAIMQQISSPVVQNSYSVETSQRKKHRSTSVISRLDPEIRMEVEKMILSGRFSYVDVKDYLAGFSISISIAVTCNYAC